MTLFKVLALGLFLFGQSLPLNVLVDKGHGLPSDYDPGVHPEAQVAVELMISEADVAMEVSSGYRSFEEQEWLVSLNSDNRAPAGHSEHQLGTAFDISAPGYASWWDNGSNRLVWEWLEENAHKYGFVISYPLKYQSELTEYIHEPWHVRYVGLELAERMHSEDYLNPNSEVIPQDYYEPLD